MWALNRSKIPWKEWVLRLPKRSSPNISNIPGCSLANIKTQSRVHEISIQWKELKLIILNRLCHSYLHFILAAPFKTWCVPYPWCGISESLLGLVALENKREASLFCSHLGSHIYPLICPFTCVTHAFISQSHCAKILLVSLEKSVFVALIFGGKLAFCHFSSSYYYACNNVTCLTASFKLNI